MAILMVISLFSTNLILIAEAASSTSGQCGSGVTWKLSGGELTISGNGSMSDYADSSDIPWYSSRSSITSVVIGSGVTGIGDIAFSGCSNLIKVTISNSVTRIGDYAFEGCTKLASVTLGSRVSTIGDGAFHMCRSLASITLPSSVTSIGAGAFCDCSSLTGIVIPSGVTRISDDTFSYCTSLASITIGSNVTHIGSSAFWNCTSLKSVKIPNSVITIGEYAFYECTGLTGITFGANLDSISDYSFCNCRSLASVSFPEKLERIGNYAFYGCSGLKQIAFVGSAPAIGESAFSGVAATARYPEGNSSWTASVRKNYGGTITWSKIPAVKIVTEPKNVTAAVGEKATVTVKAQGEGLTYKWYYKNPGASKYTYTDTFKGNTYSVTMSESRNGRYVYCVVKDAYGNTAKSKSVCLTLPESLAITKQPKSVSVAEGEIASISVSATGEGLTYTWYYKNKGASSFRKTTTFTGNFYGVDMSPSRSGRQVYCVIKDKYGNSVKTDTVTLSMTAPTPLKITKQPVSVTVENGETARVSFSASGDGLTYTWYYKNKDASSFTKTTTFKSNAYAVEMSAARSGRQVYCVVKDKYGNSVKTNIVTIKMQTPLKITSQPESVTVAKGETAKISVKAQGDGLTYEWYYKNADSSIFIYTDTFTSNTYSVSMSAARHGRKVYCLITDKYGNTAKSDTVTLKMK